MLTVLITSPRVAPGLLSWPAWAALRSASAVLAPPGHPQRPALTAAGITVGDAPAALAAAPDAPVVPAVAPDADVVWLPEPGTDPPLPPGAQRLDGAPDLPGSRLLDLVVTMDRLRSGCPWDAKQTHQSLAPHLLEEPYEALEALEASDYEAFCEELGDTLLQVMFHARIAAERTDGTGFTIDDVADGIVAKLVRRHPHVFGDVSVTGPDMVQRNWDDIKREEKRAKAARRGEPDEAAEPESSLDGVPFGQPALALAAQLQRRAERAGIPAELANLDGDKGYAAASEGEQNPPDADIGRELFRLVVRARAAGLDPEAELRAVARQYRELVRAWEHSARPLGYVR